MRNHLKEEILKAIYADARDIVAGNLPTWAPQAQELARQLRAANFRGDPQAHPDVVRAARDLIDGDMDCAFAPMAFGSLVEHFFEEMNPERPQGRQQHLALLRPGQ